MKTALCVFALGLLCLAQFGNTNSRKVFNLSLPILGYNLAVNSKVPDLELQPQVRAPDAHQRKTSTHKSLTHKTSPNTTTSPLKPPNARVPSKNKKAALGSHRAAPTCEHIAHYITRIYKYEFITKDDKTVKVFMESRRFKVMPRNVVAWYESLGKVHFTIRMHYEYPPSSKYVTSTSRKTDDASNSSTRNERIQSRTRGSCRRTLENRKLSPSAFARRFPTSYSKSFTYEEWKKKVAISHEEHGRHNVMYFIDLDTYPQRQEEEEREPDSKHPPQLPQPGTFLKVLSVTLSDEEKQLQDHIAARSLKRRNHASYISKSRQPNLMKAKGNLVQREGMRSRRVEDTRAEVERKEITSTHSALAPEMLGSTSATTATHVPYNGERKSTHVTELLKKNGSEGVRTRAPWNEGKEGVGEIPRTKDTRRRGFPGTSTPRPSTTTLLSSKAQADTGGSEEAVGMRPSSTSYEVDSTGPQPSLAKRFTPKKAGRLQAQSMSDESVSGEADNYELSWKAQAHLRPNEGASVDVLSMSMHDLRLQGIHERRMQVEVDFTLRTTWRDPRLAHALNTSTTFVPPFPPIWRPGVYLLGGGRAAMLEESLTLHPQGHLVLHQRHVAHLHCRFSFAKFPFDRQECGLQLRSFAYTTAQVDMLWSADVEEASVEVFDSLFRLSSIHLTSEKETGLDGEFRILSVVVGLRRNVFGLFKVGILPGILFTALSYLTLFLNHQPFSITRTALCVASFLIHQLTMQIYYAHSPQSASFTPFDLCNAFLSTLQLSLCLFNATLLLKLRRSSTSRKQCPPALQRIGKVMILGIPMTAVVFILIYLSTYMHFKIM